MFRIQHSHRTFYQFYRYMKIAEQFLRVTFIKLYLSFSVVKLQYSLSTLTQISSRTWEGS